MPNLDLKQLRETFAKSTQGEWSKRKPELTNKAHPTKHPHYEIGSDKSLFWIAHVLCFSDAHEGTEYQANAQFIATAHNTYAQLLDIAEAAQTLDEAVIGIRDIIGDWKNPNIPPRGRLGSQKCLQSHIRRIDDALAAYRKAREGK